MTQIKAHLMEKNIATNCSQVTVAVLAGWTKKSFGHYAILKLFSLRSPSIEQMPAPLVLDIYAFFPRRVQFKLDLNPQACLQNLRERGKNVDSSLGPRILKRGYFLFHGQWCSGKGYFLVKLNFCWPVMLHVPSISAESINCFNSVGYRISKDIKELVLIIMNNGMSTKYFMLGRETKLGYPLSPV